MAGENEARYSQPPVIDSNRPLALFDLDKTLRPNDLMNHTNFSLIKTLLRKGSGIRTLLKHLFAFSGHNMAERLHHAAANLLEGRHVEEMNELHQSFIQHIHKHEKLWFRGTVELLRHLTQRDIQILIVTGSPQEQTDLCIATLKTELDTSNITVCGSRYAVENERYTGEVEHLNATAAGKKRILDAHIPQETPVIGCAGNDIADLPLFQRVPPHGTRIAVRGRTRLRKRLQQEGYSFVYSPEDLEHAPHSAVLEVSTQLEHTLHPLLWRAE